MCGRCCKVFALKNTLAPGQWEGVRDYLECYGEVFEPLLSADGSATFHHFILAQCKHQLPDGKCGIHDHRPMVCQTYPSESTNVLYQYLRSQGVKCGYRFEARAGAKIPPQS